MIYNTILTSKGTTTIPVAIRKELGIKPGMSVSFIHDPKTGEYRIKRSQTIDEIRSLNKAALQEAKTTHKEYQSGDGFRQFIAEKYSE